MSEKEIIGLFIFTLLALSVTPAIAIEPEQLVSINIGSYDTYINSSVTVPIEIFNASAVAGGAIKILYNPETVSVQSVLPADFGTPVANIDNKEGFVYIACALPNAVEKDIARLAVVRFKGLSKGSCLLEVQNASLNDENGILITPHAITNGTLTVKPSAEQPTPTPASAPSTGVGGGGPGGGGGYVPTTPTPTEKQTAVEGVAVTPALATPAPTITPPATAPTPASTPAPAHGLTPLFLILIVTAVIVIAGITIIVLRRK